MNSLLVLGLFTLMGAVSLAASSRQLVDALTKRERDCHKTFLNQFKPDEVLSTRKLIKLPGDVYKIRIGKGRYVVVRPLKDLAAALREAFVAELFFASPVQSAVGLPQVIDSDSLRRLMIEKASPFSGSGVLVGQFDKDNLLQQSDDFVITALPFYPGDTGVQYLNMNFALDMRAALVDYRRNDGSLRLQERWRQLRPALQRQVLKDLRKLIPSMKLATADNMIAIFDKHMHEVSTKRLSRLSTTYVLKRMPREVREQLADLWALHYLVAIDDFHSANWLINGADSAKPRLIVFDFNKHPAAFFKGESEFSRQNVFGIDGDELALERDRLEAAHFEDLSPAMGEFMANLNQKTLKNLAQKVGYSLSKKEAEGIIKRARVLAPAPPQ